MNKKSKNIIKILSLTAGLSISSPFIIKFLALILNIVWMKIDCIFYNCFGDVSLLGIFTELPHVFTIDKYSFIILAYSIPLIAFFLFIYDAKKKIKLFKLSPYAFLIFFIVTAIMSKILNRIYPVAEGCVREGPLACLPFGTVISIFVGGYAFFWVFIPYLIIYAIIMTVLHFKKKHK